MCDLILPFDLGEPRCLQALVHSFMLTRMGKGSMLELSIPDDAEVIWNDRGKTAVRRRIRDFGRKAEDHQRDLDTYLISERGKQYCFPPKDRIEKSFCFRYGSAGTLPIVHWRGHDHYCLFYREVFPVGWNIANGGFDSRLEMLYPLLAVERELREELIIADPSERLRYKFAWDAGRPADRPEFGTAHILWARRLSRLGYQGFNEKDIELTWENGPDLVCLRMNDERPEPTTGCFLNINALDFGIEVDRIARIRIPDSAVLLDGEIFKQKLINAPVGLFRVERMNDLLDGAHWREPQEFIPDVFFFTGDLHRNGEEIKVTVQQEYIPHLHGMLADDVIKAWCREPHQYDLCPVTRRIIRRFMKTEAKPHDRLRYDAFLSYRHSGPDAEFARDLRAKLEAAGFRIARDVEDFDPSAASIEEMERCIRESRYTLAITSPRYMTSGFCREEAIICKTIGLAERTRRLIPLILEEAPLPAYLIDLVGIDFRDPACRAAAIKKLLKKLKHGRNGHNAP